MAKAYDKMEWIFLREMLIVMGFDLEFVDLIMLCVSTVKYQVSVNGNIFDTIIPTRGLRQGGPLLPYLFILCAEGLSYFISRAVLCWNWSSCRVSRGGLGISHLFFADDSLLFFKANQFEVVIVLDCLHKYEHISG